MHKTNASCTTLAVAAVSAAANSSFSLKKEHKKLQKIWITSFSFSFAFILIESVNILLKWQVIYLNTKKKR